MTTGNRLVTVLFLSPTCPGSDISQRTEPLPETYRHKTITVNKNKYVEDTKHNELEIYIFNSVTIQKNFFTPHYNQSYNSKKNFTPHHNQSYNSKKNSHHTTINIHTTQETTRGQDGLRCWFCPKTVRSAVASSLLCLHCHSKLA